MRSTALVAVALAALAAPASAYFHAGLLVVPDFDQIVQFHFPPPASENYRPLMRPEGEARQLFSLPKFHQAHGRAHHEHEQPLEARKFGLQRINSVNKKLVEGEIKSLAISKETDAEEKRTKPRTFHPGTWLVDQPEHVPDLEIGVIGYSRQWIGEEKLGGGWSSTANPLSGDREMLLKKFASLSMEDSERTQLRGLGVTYDETGAAHVMPQKS